MNHDDEVVADSEGEEKDILQTPGEPSRPLETKYPSPRVNVDIVSISSSIADRAKLRSRSTKPLAAVIDTIELSSDEDVLDLLPIPQTGNLASKKSRQKKSRSEDHSAPNPRPRPRPRPILKSKDSIKTTHPMSSLLVPTCQRTTPLPLSSSPPEADLPIPFKLLPLQLTPSDPPSSTSNPYDHPPIETLPNLDTEPDVTSSPPSSLFSIRSSRRKKRLHRTSPVDELDPDDNELADRRRMPPPAPSRTFFASSSSPPTELNNRNTSSSCNEDRREKRVPTKKGGKNTPQVLTASETKPKPRKGVQNKARVVLKSTNAKGKGKGKEVFKSIEEGDNGVQTGLETKATRARAGSITSLSSLPDSDSRDGGKAGSSKKRKSMDERHPLANTDERDVPQPQKRTKNRRRVEQTIFSDEEGVGMKNIKPTVSRTGAAAETNEKGQGKQARAVQEKEDHGVIPCTEEVIDHTISKENHQPTDLRTSITAKPSMKQTESPVPTLSSRYTIAPRTKSTPMSDLIRRVNSLPGSPFHSPAPRPSGSSIGKLAAAGTAYSPYLKSSRSALSRIAPLHPNRRTPPPPLPPPPPRKKTKKELEREEKWEEELIESVGGITDWACMTDAERVELRRAKREREMGGWDD